MEHKTVKVTIYLMGDNKNLTTHVKKGFWVGRNAEAITESLSHRINSTPAYNSVSIGRYAIVKGMITGIHVEEMI